VLKPKLIMPVALLLVGAVAAGVAAAIGVRHRQTAPKITGTELNRATPNVPLLNKEGQRVTLAHFRGKVVRSAKPGSATASSSPRSASTRGGTHRRGCTPSSATRASTSRC